MIYRVAKCEIDLPGSSYDCRSEVDKTKKCRKVSQSAIKCDRFWIMNQNSTRGTVPYGVNRMVGRGAERLCVDDYSILFDSSHNTNSSQRGL
jgi:hypothetical protein